jgi:endonuclease/exonuclease/phosphatase family metal-dependent hydrolase
MNCHFVGLVLLLAGSLFANFGVSSSVRIATYNILDFPESYGLQRLDDLRQAIGYMNPDILVVQEMHSQNGVDLMLDSVMLPLSSAFTSAPFHDGPGTDNALFYRHDRIDYLGAQYHSTTNRDIAEYRLLLNDFQRELYLFSVHLKASEGVSNEAIRLEEATSLRNRLNTYPPGTDFAVAGDFNIYYSDEPAFHMLTDSIANNNGRLFDPLSSIGYWHANSNYAFLHTQSSRVEQLPDGGAGGGLDDRFDMILCSKSLLDSAGLLLLRNSYTVCGNDGAHFNLSVNYGSNSQVPSQVADALYWATDHLPVFADILIDTALAPEEPIVKVWPNPMQEWAQITFPWHDDFVRARLTMTNILGQRVYETEVQDPAGCRIDRNDLPLGVYFLHVSVQTRFSTYKYQTNLAVVK